MRHTRSAGLCSTAGLVAAIGAFVLGLSVLSGCGSSPPPNLYLLSGSAGPSQMSASPVSTRGALHALSIGVVRPTLPEYLDRPEIVFRDSANQVRVSENDRWAERLPVNMAQVMAQDLTGFLPGATVMALPDESGREVDLEVNLDLTAFEPAADGSAVAVGRWSVRNQRTSEEIAAGRVDLKETTGKSGYAGVAEAMSRNLYAISQQIATAIQVRAPAIRTALARAARRGGNSGSSGSSGTQ
jgi:uncharacterized protein